MTADLSIPLPDREILSAIYFWGETVSSISLRVG